MSFLDAIGRMLRSGAARARRPRPAPQAAEAADAFAWYEQLRRAGPVHHLPEQRGWVVLGFDEVQRALADPARFSSRTPVLLQLDPVLIGNDAPAHTAIRRIMARQFSPASVARRSELAGHAAERLLRPLREGGEMDLVGGLANPLADAVAGELIGFDAPAIASFAKPTLEAGGNTEVLYAGLAAPIAAAAERTSMYRDLRGEEGGGLDEDSARSLIRLLWVAGTVETKRALALAVLLLLEHEEVRARIQADTRLLGPYVTEALRLRPPEHFVPRVAAETVEIGGVVIPAGAPVNLCLAAANRDPARFPDPASLRLDRAPGAHLSFGGGAHRCIGAALARAQITITLRTLLRVAPGFRAVKPLSTIRYTDHARVSQIAELFIAG